MNLQAPIQVLSLNRLPWALTRASFRSHAVGVIGCYYAFYGVPRLRKTGSVATGDFGIAYKGNEKKEDEFAIPRSIKIVSPDSSPSGQTREHLNTSEPTYDAMISWTFHESF